jgi:hypothetical protein
VAATDLLVADPERVFAPRLAGAKGPCLLLNAEERVIVSNAVSHNVGDVVRATAEFERAELGVFGWLLATQAASSPSRSQPVG